MIMKGLKNKDISIGNFISRALLVAVVLVMLLIEGGVPTPIGILSVGSGEVLSSPDTERLSPDTLIDQTELLGGLSYIQDDPDDPDGNWLEATGENVDTMAHVGFPTPALSPTPGTNLQEFRIWVKKIGGTGTPTVRIDLYEGGSFVGTVLAESDVTSTGGQLFYGKWNASSLSTPDGSAVECYIYGTRTGGGKKNRAAVSVGAVEWNVEYTLPPPGISQIVFITGPQTINAGEASGIMTVQTRDALGTPSDVTSDTTIDLSSNSATGRFDTSQSGPFDGLVTSVTIPSGSNSASFYYKDTTVGMPTITAAENPGQGWTDATQMETVNHAALEKFSFAHVNDPIVNVPFSITITAQDQYDNTVTSYTGTNTLSDSTGTISPTTTAAFINGVWTGNVTISTVQDKVLITTTDDGKTGVSNSIDVSPAGISRIVFITGPQTITAGEASDIMTVQTQDASGNSSDVTSDTTIDLSSNSATGRFDTSQSGPFDGSVTSVTIPSGSNSASFYYKDTTVGMPTITAVENPAQGWTDATQPVTVNHAALEKFSFAHVNDPIVNVAFSIIITAQDQYDNTVTSYTDTNTLSDSTGTISPTTTTAFISGVWTGNVTISTVQDGVLITTTDDGKTGTSNLFNVDPAAISQIVFTTPARTINAGEASGIMTVQTRDALGTPSDVTSNTTINLSSTSLAGKFSLSDSSWSDVTSVTITNGTNSASFYYKDTTAGTLTITAAETPDQGWTDANQPVTVNAGPTIQFTLTASSGDESVTPANLELTLSAASGQDVTVDYTVTGGTATGGGVDYTLAADTATITKGNLTTNINVAIVDDTLNEPDETIVVTISNPTNANLGANTQHTYEILGEFASILTKTTSAGDYTVDNKAGADTEVDKSGAGTLEVSIARYKSNPYGSAPSGFQAAGDYIDVHLDDITGVDEIVIRKYYTNADISGLVESSLRIYYWNGTAWTQCSDSGVDTTDITGPPAYSGYVWAKLREDTTPDLSHLLSSSFSSMASPVSPTPTPSDGGGGSPPTPSPPASLPPPGTTDISNLVTAGGVFTQSIIIQSADGACQLAIDKGTVGLTSDGQPISEISILNMETPPPLPEDSNVIGLVYDFGPDGATFDPPIFLTFTYDERLIPPGAAEADLVPVMWDEETGGWVALELWIVDPETNTITGLIRHFTPSSILAYIRPVAFTTSDMLIIPTEVNTGETVNIFVSVTNTGGQPGSYEATLKINGVAEASSKVTIAAGDSALVSFSTTKDTAGTYLLEIDGISGSFTVKERPEAPPTVTPPTVTPPAVTPPTPTPPITPTPFNWPVTGGIIAGLAAMAGLVYFLLIHRRYRYAPSTYPVEVERPAIPPPPPKPISYPAAINIQEVIGRFMAAIATAIVGGVGFLVSKREVITRLLAAVASAIAGGVGFLVGKREVITRLLASVATAIAGGVGFLVGKREVITRLLASVATAIAGGVGFLVSKREVITRLLASVATAIIGWVRLLLSKWKTKKPR